MAVTQSQLDALVSAYLSGTTSVSYDGRTVQYRTLADIRSLVETTANVLGVDDPLAAITIVPRGRRRIYLTSNKGL